MAPFRQLGPLSVTLTATTLLWGPSLVAATQSSEPPPDDTSTTLTAEDNCLPRATVPERTAILGGTTEDGAFWVTGFGEDERGIQMVCVDITFDGEPAAQGRIGGPFEAAADPSEMVVALMNVGRRAGPRWYVVRGTVTADAARVELSFDGAEPVEAELAATGPVDGWLWFALTVPHSGDGTPRVTATAYDTDDEPIATGENLFS